MASDSKSVTKLIGDRLTASGFKRAKPGVFTRSATSAILSWVGLNQAKRGGFVEVNPVVGVRHQPVEALVAELNGEPFDEVVPPTAAMNLGYILASNGYVCFVFDGSRPDAEVADGLVRTVIEATASFVSKNESLEGLVDTLATSKRLMPAQTAYRLPAALCLCGRREEACRAVDAKVRDIGGRTDPAATRYQAFAARLRDHMRELSRPPQIL